MKKFMIVLAMIVWCVPVVSSGDDLFILGDDSGPPKYYVEDGTPKGFIVDITIWCLEEMNHPYTIELSPWKRAYKTALAGKGGIIGLSMNSERLEIFDYSEPLYYGDLMVVVKNGNEFPFQAIPDLQGKVIGVGRGSSYGDAFDVAVAEGIFTVDEFTKPASALKMVLSDRLDAILIGPGTHGVQQVVATDSKLRMDDFAILPVPFKRDAKYLGIPKSLGMQEFLETFNATLKKGQETGIIDEIVDSYYTE